MSYTARHRADADPVALARDAGAYWTAELVRSLTVRTTPWLRRTLVAMSAAALALSLVGVHGIPATAAPQSPASAARPASAVSAPPPVVYISPATAAPALAARDAYGVTVPPPPETPDRVTWPVAVGTVVSSPFGPRVAPCPACSTDHRGIDLVPGDGTPVAAVADGVVVVAAADAAGDLGVSVTIRHRIRGAWVETVYAHLRLGSMALRVGDRVRRGQIVGLVGNTGVSTGPHLHFGVLRGGQPTDPIAWLNANADR